MGNRLEKETDMTIRRDAIICYLCSVSLEPLVTRWQSDLGNKNVSAKDLTKVVELVMIARQAALQRGRPVDVIVFLFNIIFLD